MNKINSIKIINDKIEDCEKRLKYVYDCICENETEQLIAEDNRLEKIYFDLLSERTELILETLLKIKKREYEELKEKLKDFKKARKNNNLDEFIVKWPNFPLYLDL